MSSTGDFTDLQCSLCLRQFRDPIILHCGHTFDRACIQQVIENAQLFRQRQTIECPLCKRTFDRDTPLIPNQSVFNLIHTEPTYECFVIDISSSQEKSHALTFFKQVFSRRDIYDNDRITLETEDTWLTFNANIDFEQKLEIRAITNLEGTLSNACAYLRRHNGLRKICILTDGLTKHPTVTRINFTGIKQRLLIHIGDRNSRRTRQLADAIDFDFGHFNEKTLNTYVGHFLANFCQKQ